ncbi:MAG TPA: hypothetical protein VN963_04300, partial [bacterium]|nr:hypothetical protein [bacterium]
NTRLPILGDIPILGDFFTGNVNNTDAQTDILLTITPRIIRDWTFPRKDYQEIYSGTQDNLSSKPIFALFKGAQGAGAPKIEVGEPVGLTAQTSGSLSSSQELAVNSPSPNGGVILSFEQPQYEATLGQPVEIKLYGENMGKLRNMPLAVAFNANYLKFVSASAGSAGVEKVEADADDKHGLLRMNLTLKPDQAVSGPMELVDLKLTGYTPGLSYLIFLNPTFKDENGNDVHAQARASRIVVK